MKAAERFSEKETFMFQDGPSGQLLQSVDLVVVTEACMTTSITNMSIRRE